MHKVTLIPGEGIGPEVSAAACRIVEAAGVKIEWEQIQVAPVQERRQERFRHSEWVESIRRNRVALKGPITTPIAEGPPSLNVAIRKALELYANLRPVRNLPGVKTRFENVDLVVVRENTEDLYSGLEHTVVPGVVESLKIITERASTRIARFAFEYARRYNRRKICAVHKATSAAPPAPPPPPNSLIPSSAPSSRLLAAGFRVDSRPASYYLRFVAMNPIGQQTSGLIPCPAR